MGTGVTVGFQARAAKILTGNKGLASYKNKRRGQRLSYIEIDKLVFGNLSREFLVPEGYDGYYAPRKYSIFHKGTFHSEIMINQAYQTIERVHGPAPVVSDRSLEFAMPRIFQDFCKGTTRLVRPYGDMTIFCTGGMGVKLYLQMMKRPLPPKIRRTSDYDFTFAIPKVLKTEKILSSYIFTMKKIMTSHLSSFIRYINRNYKGANARLQISNFTRSPHDNPRVQVPGTKRRVYQVISYRVITGKNTVTDLVDTALAVYPGSSRAMLHLPFSYSSGIPIQKFRYQLKDSLALLSGSFLYGGLIAQRNPITGKVKEKGLKNAERISQLLKVSGHFSKNVKPLLNNVARGNLKTARKNSVRVNKVVKKIK
jgi:hypothetical protein